MLTLLTDSLLEMLKLRLVFSPARKLSARYRNRLSVNEYRLSVAKYRLLWRWLAVALAGLGSASLWLAGSDLLALAGSSCLTNRLAG